MAWREEGLPPDIRLDIIREARKGPGRPSSHEGQGEGVEGGKGGRPTGTHFAGTERINREIMEC
jgi:hypothetical protein